MIALQQPRITVVGGGLSGCEAAWQAAQQGVAVLLLEMRPLVNTPAHRTGLLAELVCSNSLGSDQPDRAAGLLKVELRRARSLLMQAADATAVPAGGALAVDREAFAAWVTQAIEAHALIRVVREEAKDIPDGIAVLATGPLTSDALARELATLTGQENLFFYDAMAPIVTAESIDMATAFRQSRYRGREEADGGDYINCPMDRATFESFAAALAIAEQIELQPFDYRAPSYFEGCLPI